MAKKQQVNPKQLWKVQVNFTAPDGSEFDDIYKVVVGSADRLPRTSRGELKTYSKWGSYGPSGRWNL